MSGQYEQKPGTGTLFANRNKTGKGPDYKGFFQLPSGEIVGLAAWVRVTGSGASLMSVAIDDREGEYQARKLRLPQLKGEAPREQRAEPRREFGGGMTERERAGFGRGDDEDGSLFARRAREADDFDDDIPF